MKSRIRPFDKNVCQLTMCLYPMLFFPAIVSITNHASLSGSPSPASIKRRIENLASKRVIRIIVNVNREENEEHA